MEERDCIWEKEIENNICTNSLSDNCGKKCNLRIQKKCPFYEVEKEENEG